MTHRCVLLSDGARPTETIYCLAAADRLREVGVALERIDARLGWWGRRPRSRLVEQRLAGNTVIVCRSLAEDWIEWLEARRDQLAGVVYLIDDDLVAAAACEALPTTYRRRMARAAKREMRLLALADTVVVTSSVLRSRFVARHRDVRLLTPRLVAPVPNTRHFERPRWRSGFHGTRAHAADLAAIAPAVRQLRAERTGMDFEVMLGQHTPASLHDCCRVRRPRQWRAYRRLLGRARLHVGLVPLLPGTFNEGKSWIKFLETASMGAVGVFSARAPYTEVVEHGVDGLLVGDDPDAWFEAVRWLLDHPAEAEAMAQRAGQKAREVGDPAGAAQFWQALVCEIGGRG